MEIPGEESPIEPVLRISDEGIKRAVIVLQSAQDQRPLVRERLKSLAQELVRLLDEIELYGTVVYCGESAACLLHNRVLRVLAGSVMWESIWRQPRKRTRICQDEFWHAPSPAATAALNRSTANGMEEWKDRFGRSINAIYKNRADEAKKADGSV